jgi:hypothetical protein
VPAYYALNACSISDFKGMYIKQIESVGLDFHIIALFFSYIHMIVRLPLLGNPSISRDAKLQNAAVAASKLNVFAFPARCTKFALHKRALARSLYLTCKYVVWAQHNGALVIKSVAARALQVSARPIIWRWINQQGSPLAARPVCMSAKPHCGKANARSTGEFCENRAGRSVWTLWT